jgi:hypothetical protein
MLIDPAVKGKTLLDPMETPLVASKNASSLRVLRRSRAAAML